MARPSCASPSAAVPAASTGLLAVAAASVVSPVVVVSVVAPSPKRHKFSEELFVLAFMVVSELKPYTEQANGKTVEAAWQPVARLIIERASVLKFRGGYPVRQLTPRSVRDHVDHFLVSKLPMMEHAEVRRSGEDGVAESGLLTWARLAAEDKATAAALEAKRNSVKSEKKELKESAGRLVVDASIAVPSSAVVRRFSPQPDEDDMPSAGSSAGVGRYSSPPSVSRSLGGSRKAPRRSDAFAVHRDLFESENFLRELVKIELEERAERRTRDEDERRERRAREARWCVML